MRYLAARITGTIVAFFGWLAFIVLYLAFYAGGLDFWQKLAIFIASGSILVVVIAIIWLIGHSISALWAF